jgi:hypothetical protein
MKVRSAVLIILLFSIGLNCSVAQKPSIGGYSVFYGTLHNHSNVIEGISEPSECYLYARDTGRMDFFGLADHDFGIDPSKWNEIIKAAQKYSQDGVFAGFWGFEWSSDVGHVSVINTNDYCSCKNKPTDTFKGLLDWLADHECVAFFNHPGRENADGNEFDHFLGDPSDKMVGMELWNGRNDFSRYYYNDGYFPNDGYKSFFAEAIERGWRLGASGSEDNHRSDFGTYTQKRLAILADTLTRLALFKALKERRFFSTLDKNLALSFKIDKNEMGSVIPGGKYTLQIRATDNNNEIFTMVQIFKNGSLLKVWHIIENEINIIDTLQTADGDFYYVKVTQEDGNEAISSPIFIKKQ